METSSALPALCAGNSPVTGEFPAQRPVTRSFDVFFDLRLNKRLSKQSWGWWLGTLSRPVWRYCNVLLLTMKSFWDKNIKLWIWKWVILGNEIKTYVDNCPSPSLFVLWMVLGHSYHLWNIYVVIVVITRDSGFVCVCVYVCHDVCPEDLTMKDWCHTNNVL